MKLSLGSHKLSLAVILSCNKLLKAVISCQNLSKGVIIARLILTLGARYKDALWLKMFLFIYKNDLPKKNFFFFATTG